MMYKNNIVRAAGLTGYTTSHDGGNTWTASVVQDITDIDFADANTGFASGLISNPASKTTDGGSTWNPVILPVNSSMQGVSCLNANTVFFCGLNGHVFRTTNGGSSVDDVSTGIVTEDNEDVFVIDANTIILAGSDGIIRRSTNAGMTWASVYTSGGSALHSLSFSGFTGYACGDNGTIAKTSNGGSSWTTQSSGVNVSLNGIYFYDPDNGIAVGDNGTIIRTTDGGAGWFSENAGASTDLYCAVLLSPFVGIVGGDAGLILRKTGLSTGLLSQAPAFTYKVWNNALTHELMVEVSGLKFYGSLTLQIYDSRGKKIVTCLSAKDGLNRFPVSFLPPGMYFCSLGAGNLILETRKIMVMD
ncbi:MAG: hypothetical protein IT242_11805 [Bacteroidia bacterium]|nr:hypothetical protein [Bacteroidia bacterium]